MPGFQNSELFVLLRTQLILPRLLRVNIFCESLSLNVILVKALFQSVGQALLKALRGQDLMSELKYLPVEISSQLFLFL